MRGTRQGGAGRRGAGPAARRTLGAGTGRGRVALGPEGERRVGPWGSSGLAPRVSQCPAGGWGALGRMECEPPGPPSSPGAPRAGCLSRDSLWGKGLTPVPDSLRHRLWTPAHPPIPQRVGLAIPLSTSRCYHEAQRDLGRLQAWLGPDKGWWRRKTGLSMRPETDSRRRSHPHGAAACAGKHAAAAAACHIHAVAAATCVTYTQRRRPHVTYTKQQGQRQPHMLHTRSGSGHTLRTRSSHICYIHAAAAATCYIHAVATAAAATDVPYTQRRRQERQWPAHDSDKQHVCRSSTHSHTRARRWSSLPSVS